MSYLKQIVAVTKFIFKLEYFWLKTGEDVLIRDVKGHQTF